MKTRSELDYRRRIARVLAAIDADPAAAHKVEDLAALAHFSPFHFHRLYRQVTGETVAATLRRARLGRAARHLAGGQSVTDAAFDAGYESTQSFARAFRQQTGLTPTGFQDRVGALAVPAAPLRLVTRDPVPVHCLVHDGPLVGIGHTYVRLLRRELAGLGDVLATLPLIGIAQGDPTVPGGFHYAAGVVLPPGMVAPAALRPRVVPGGLYVDYRLEGPPVLISAAFRALFCHWLPAQGLRPAAGPHLELYHGDLTAPGNTLITDLLIPVLKEE